MSACVFDELIIKAYEQARDDWRSSYMLRDLRECTVSRMSALMVDTIDQIRASVLHELSILSDSMPSSEKNYLAGLTVALSVARESVRSTVDREKARRSISNAPEGS